MSVRIEDDACFQEFAPDPSKVGTFTDLFEIDYFAWMIAGWATILSSLISLFLVFKHTQYYTRPNQQRCIIRIIWMVPAYTITSWLSFFFYREMIYLDLVRDCYESIVYLNFFVLLLQYLSDEAAGQDKHFKARKWESIAFAFPMCWIKFHPGRAHFLQLLKYSVIQYAVLRPLFTAIACVVHYFGYLCPNSFSPKYFNLWFTVILCISVNIAFYALIMLYMTIADDMQSYDPFSKFFVVKLILFYPFYQYTVIAVAANFGLIHPTKYWTQANVVNGIQSLLICVEFIVFAIMLSRVFDYREYRPVDRRRTPCWRGWVDAMNPMDFIREFFYGIQYMKYSLFRGKPPKRIADGRRSTMDITEVMSRLHPGQVVFPKDWEVATEEGDTDGVGMNTTAPPGYNYTGSSENARFAAMEEVVPYGIRMTQTQGQHEFFKSPLKSMPYVLDPEWAQRQVGREETSEQDQLVVFCSSDEELGVKDTRRVDDDDDDVDSLDDSLSHRTCSRIADLPAPSAAFLQCHSALSLPKLTTTTQANRLELTRAVRLPLDSVRLFDSSQDPLDLYVGEVVRHYHEDRSNKSHAGRDFM